MAQRANLKEVRAVLLDMDGVVYVGEEPLPGVQELLDYLEATGRNWLFVTNNSSRTPNQFVEKVGRMGIGADEAHILSSALATASWLAEQYPNGVRAFMIGQDGLRSALEQEGITIVEDAQAADVIVSGIDFSVRYERLADATLAIRAGARFIGTNSDTSFPSERGQIPGTGALLALLEAATGVTPTVIGKPNAGMFQQAMHKLGTKVSSTLMVGDRYETDIAGAIELGMPTAAVLTGITTEEEFHTVVPKPDLILPGLPELLEAFQQADN